MVELNISEELESRRIKTLELVSNISRILGYKQELMGFFRISKNGTNIKKWCYFEGVHSENGISTNDERGYLVEFFGGEKITISIDGNLEITGSNSISLLDSIAKHPEIGSLIAQLRYLEQEYRDKKGIKHTVADAVHMKLVDTSI